LLKVSLISAQRSEKAPSANIRQPEKIQDPTSTFQDPERIQEPGSSLSSKL